MRASASEPLFQARHRILPDLQIHCDQTASDAQFAAADARVDHVPDHHRRHGRGLADLDVSDRGSPNFFAGVRVDRNRVVVERVVNDLAVSKARAAIDDVATGDPHRAIIRIGMKNPFLGKSGFRKIERNQVIGKGGNNIQRIIYDQRLAFVAVRYARRGGRHDMKILNVARVDLIERAEPGVPVITGRHGPLAVGQGRDKMDVGPRTGNGDRRAALCDGGHPSPRYCAISDENELRDR